MVSGWMKKAVYFSLACLVIVGCKKEGLLEFDTLEHNSQWLVPLIRTVISAEEASKIENVGYNLDVNASDFGFFITGFPIPPITNQSVGPYAFDAPADFFKRFKSDTAVVKIVVTNNLPVNIKGGSKFEVSNVSDGVVVYSGELMNDIDPMGGMDSLVVTNVVTSPWIEKELNFSITSLGTDGSGGAIPDFTDATLDVDFKVEVLQVNEVTLCHDLDFVIDETVDYSFDSEMGATEEQEEIFQEGKINFFITNGVPLDLGFQVYFLDASKTIIDSLLDNSVIESAPIDASGYVASGVIPEQKLVFDLTLESYRRLEKDTRFMNVRMGLASPLNSGEFTIVNNNEIGIIITTDIKTKLSANL